MSIGTAPYVVSVPTRGQLLLDALQESAKRYGQAVADLSHHPDDKELEADAEVRWLIFDAFAQTASRAVDGDTRILDSAFGDLN